MPRKKTKHQFRRGTEQKYLKATALSVRQSDGFHFPYMLLIYCLVAAALVFTITIYRPSLPEIPTMPGIDIPEISIPQIQTPAVIVPEIRIDFNPIITGLLGLGTLLGRVFESLLQFSIVFVQLIVNVFTLSIQAAMQIALQSCVAVLLFWKSSFFFFTNLFFELFLNETLFFYQVIIMMWNIFFTGLTAIVELLIQAFVFTYQLLVMLVQSVFNAITSVIDSINNAGSNTNKAISDQFDAIGAATKPYVDVFTRGVSSSMSQLKACFAIFAQTSGEIAHMYQQNAK